MNRHRWLWWFALLEVVSLLFVFRDGLWGRSLLAPLDIAPAMLTKYAYVSPGASKVPANHYIVDQLYYDLPLQQTLYQSWRRWEVPWWDPYTYGGRPLLADAHINGTDPVRWVAYQWLPFELAYNWTLIVHSLLCGAGALILLRSLGAAPGHAVWWALTYQWAGCFALFFGHPWIQGSFVYYPFLWVLWHRAWTGGRGWEPVIAALPVAGALYAGNLQSHAYVLVFALAFALGYAGRSGAKWRRGFGVQWPGLLLGGLLAAPVLLNQVEFFLVGSRRVESQFGPAGFLSWAASGASVFPWFLGTFRTLDLSKAFGQSALGFLPWVGCAGVLLALFGVRRRQATSAEPGTGEARTAVWLVGAYLLVASTPLTNYLYVRCAPLAVLGLVILGVRGARRLELPVEHSGWLRRGVAGVLGLVVLLQLFAWGVYPRIVDRIEASYAKRSSPSFQEVPALRQFQVRNLPREITVQNPEVALGVIALVALWVCLGPGSADSRKWRVHLLLALNLAAPLVFTARFVPRHEVALWARIHSGGPEQQRVAALVRAKDGRLADEAPDQLEQLFPGAMAHLQQVRVVHGYSALQPRSVFVLSPAERAQLGVPEADIRYVSEARGRETGQLSAEPGEDTVRFRWLGPGSRHVRESAATLNRVRLSVSAGAAGELLWTDTWYPGWRAWWRGQEVPLSRSGACWSRMTLPAGEGELLLAYQPRWLGFGYLLLACGFGGAVLALVRGCRRTRV